MAPKITLCNLQVAQPTRFAYPLFHTSLSLFWFLACRGVLEKKGEPLVLKWKLSFYCQKYHFGVGEVNLTRLYYHTSNRPGFVYIYIDYSLVGILEIFPRCSNFYDKNPRIAPPTFNSSILLRKNK